MKTLKIGGRGVGDDHRCLVIAEIGSNHNNDIELVKKMVKSAAESGVDVVKFQSFKADELVVKQVVLQGEQKINPNWKLLKGLELPLEWHKELYEYCNDHGVIFMSSPWDYDSVDLLESIGVEAYKIGSSDLTYYPFLRYIAAKKKPIILSVGMSTLDQINEAIKVIESEGNDQIGLLHCIVNYPPQLESVNLNYLKKLMKTYEYPIGFSDHNVQNAISLAAVGLGAKVIEKHITVSREMKGPDHGHAITLEELDLFVKDIRSVEKALGSEDYQPGQLEFNRIQRARRSAYAVVDIEPGVQLSDDCVKWLRPGGQIAPKDMGKLFNLKAKKKIIQYKNIEWEDVE